RIFCWPDAEIDFESKAKTLGEMRRRQHHRRSAALARPARVDGIPARAVVIGYVAFKSGRLSPAAAPNAQRHISAGATLRIKCGAPHLVRQSRTPGSVRGAEVPRFPTATDHVARRSPAAPDRNAVPRQRP